MRAVHAKRKVHRRRPSLRRSIPRWPVWRPIPLNADARAFSVALEDWYQQFTWYVRIPNYIREVEARGGQG